MSITQSVNLNLSDKVAPLILHMSQGDSNSRVVLATLWDGTQPFVAPAGSIPMVRFGKPDGTGGLYDHTESGDAVSYSGSTVTIPVATQMLSVAGVVDAEIDFYGGSGDKPVKLATFIFRIMVEKSAYPDDTIMSSDYYNIIAKQIQKALESGEKADQAIQAAATAVESATKAESAKTAAEQAKTSAENATTMAQNAKSDAQTANASAQASKTAAENAANSASSSAQNAASSATDANSAKNQAQSAASSAAADAEDAEAWAVGERNGQPVSSSDPTYHNNAKYYKDQAQGIAGGGVTSFNGRFGSVDPKSGDYSKEMVGLGNVDNTSDLNKPISTKQQEAFDAIKKKIPTQLSDLNEDSTHRVVTDVEKNVWNDKVNKSTKVPVTLLASGWAGEEAPYTYTVTLSGVTSNSIQDWTNDPQITTEQVEAWQEACVFDAGQSTNTVVFKAFGEKPAIDIPLICILRKDL